MLKIGYARLDITPPLGSPLAGYYRKRIAEGVLDPVELVALAANDGVNTVLIIAADFIGIKEKWATEIRNLISDKTDVPTEHIYIHCLHQHTSVRIGYDPHMYDMPSYSDFEDSTYYDILYRKFVDVSKMAINDMSEAEMSVAQKKTAEDISFVRRYRLKDGSIRTCPSRKIIEQLEDFVGEADNTVRLVKFTRPGAKDIALVNFSTHPDVISGNKFSADWPGFVRRMTENDISNVQCIVVNGAQGDTNHLDFFAENGPRSGYEHSEYMGRTITDVVVDMWDKTEKKNADYVSGQIQTKYIRTNSSGIEKVEECAEIRKKCLEGLFEIKDLAEKADIFRTATFYNKPFFQKILISVIGIGDCAFVGISGEPFTKYAEVFRAAAPELFVITTCNTNGEEGYLPTKEAFEEAGYEKSATNFTIELVDTVHQTVKEMLDNIKK